MIMFALSHAAWGLQALLFVAGEKRREEPRGAQPGKLDETMPVARPADMLTYTAVFVG